MQSKLKEKHCNVRGTQGYAEPEVINIDEPMEVPSPVVEDDLMIVETREEEANFDEAILNQIIERSLIEQNSNNLQTQNDATRDESQTINEQATETLATTPEISKTIENRCISNDLDSVNEGENDIELIEEDSTTAIEVTKVAKDTVDRHDYEKRTNVDAVQQENETLISERSDPEERKDRSNPTEDDRQENDLNVVNEEENDIEFIEQDPVILDDETNPVEDITKEQGNMELDNLETGDEPVTTTEEISKDKE